VPCSKLQEDMIIIVMTLVYMQMHKGVSDPLDVVAAEISDEAIILCLDEFVGELGLPEGSLASMPLGLY